MTTTPEVEHLHGRPDWGCRACGLPWPCVTARVRLLHEYRAFPSLLRIYLSAQMYEAIEDMLVTGKASPSHLYERFIGWAPSQSRPR
ncbi:hypothetical protein BJY16_000447 [Actinoplanes octamycinicus]|uniref:Flavin reductase n=1 Tax=Actinoplanes octamycinicus TaxID=135948 RepID=A0A7W7GRM3_9ACTN|nr:hypothetical protein [Actinoplanes octamycinicus]MBB4736988.1 hypothetical protein [Actinoplanes octamycinicus]GIE62125.1 hypothetical protein Aoc01nite_75270 [Actinoplanes octamycinicus]